jgi:biopolymer transport protein ExbB/TolQ
MKLLMGNALWQLTTQSDFVTKIILLALLGLSILCWAFFFYKIILLRVKKRHVRQALILLDAIKNVDQLLITTTQLSGTVPGYFLATNVTLIKDFLQKKEGLSKELSADELAMIREQAYATIDDIAYHEDASLTLFSTTAAISPLLGLFGTVWGLIHAFVRISEKQSADITTVAPGIAEALITTLAGLMVAIPTMIMYNYLLSQSGILEQRLTSLAQKLMVVIQKVF